MHTRAIALKYILTNTSSYAKLSIDGEVFGKIIDDIKLPGTNAAYFLTIQKIFTKIIETTSKIAAMSIPLEIFLAKALTANPTQTPFVSLNLI
jgi:hypothetical protein